MRTGSLGLAAGTAAALLLAAAACRDQSPNTCFDSNGFSYGFYLGRDTSLVFHWPASRMPMRVYADPATVTLPDAVAGLQTWIGAFHCGEAWAVLTVDSTHADIIVRVVGALPARLARAITLGSDSVGVCVGRTDGTYDTTLTLEGPVRSYIAPVGAPDSVALSGCLRMTTTHELGHALGILAHSTDPADLMYTTPRRSSLSLNDRYTLQLLYHTTPTIRPFPLTP